MKIRPSVKKITVAGGGILAGTLGLYEAQRRLRALVAQQYILDSVLAQCICAIGMAAGEFSALVYMAGGDLVPEKDALKVTELNRSLAIFAGRPGHPHFRRLDCHFQAKGIGSVTVVIRGHADAVKQLHTWLRTQAAIDVHGVSLQGEELTFRLPCQDAIDAHRLRARIESAQAMWPGRSYPVDGEGEGG